MYAITVSNFYIMIVAKHLYMYFIFGKEDFYCK